MKIIKKILLVVVGIIILVITCSFFYGVYLYLRLDPFLVKDSGLSGPHSNMIMYNNDQNPMFGLSESESKNYLAPWTLISVTSSERYFNDRKDRSTFPMPNLALYSFSYFVNMEKYVLCSNKTKDPIFYKATDINQSWFSVSGIKNTIIYDKKILPLLKIDNYPLDLTLVKGNTCKDKMLKEFTLSYDMGRLTLEEKKIRQEEKIKSMIQENKIILETPHN